MSEKKKLLLFLIPFITIGILLTNTWVNFLTTDSAATWRHYVGLILFVLVIVLTLKKTINFAILATGGYLILAIFNILAITEEITTSYMRIGPLYTPPIQLRSLGLFIVYFVVNWASLINIYVDHDEAKRQKEHRN